MRFRHWRFAVLFVSFLALGCAGEPPPAPPVESLPTAIVYAARTDWLVDVDKLPAAVPPGWPTAGFPPLKSLALGTAAPDAAQVATLAPEVGKSILKVLDKANGVAEKDRLDIHAEITRLFGSPLAPTVTCRAEDAKASALPEADRATAVAAPAILDLEDATLARGAGVYRQWCISCHGPTGAGDGPAASALQPQPRDYRSGTFKFRTVGPEANAGGKPRRDDLARTIRRGLDGSMMPAFPLLADDDLHAVVSYVIHLGIRGETEYRTLKQFCSGDNDAATKEVAVALVRSLNAWGRAANARPAAPGLSAEIDLAAAVRGHKLFIGEAGCLACHVGYGKAPNLKYDAWAGVVQPRNLTLGLYRGGRSADDLYARIYCGIAGVGMPTHEKLLENPPGDGSNRIVDLVHFVRALGDAKLRERLRQEFGVRLE